MVPEKMVISLIPGLNYINKKLSQHSMPSVNPYKFRFNSLFIKISKVNIQNNVPDIGQLEGLSAKRLFWKVWRHIHLQMKIRFNICTFLVEIFFSASPTIIYATALQMKSRFRMSWMQPTLYKSIETTVCFTIEKNEWPLLALVRIATKKGTIFCCRPFGRTA